MKPRIHRHAHRIDFRTGTGVVIACWVRKVELTVPVIEKLNAMCDELAPQVNGRAVFWQEEREAT